MTEEVFEEKLSKKEEKLKLREETLMQNYTNDEGKMRDKCKLLGKDTKTFWLYNPDNEHRIARACDESGIDIELKAYTDVFPMDAWYSKPKGFVCQLKKISGKDLANPLLSDRRLMLLINGDVFYTLSEARKRYHLVKELSRILYNYEKDQYKILKYDYQNNSNIMSTFGATPTEDKLKEVFGEGE